MEKAGLHPTPRRTLLQQWPECAEGQVTEGSGQGLSGGHS